MEIETDLGKVESWIQVTREDVARLGIHAGDRCMSVRLTASGCRPPSSRSSPRLVVRARLSTGEQTQVSPGLRAGTLTRCYACPDFSFAPFETTLLTQRWQATGCSSARVTYGASRPGSGAGCRSARSCSIAWPTVVREEMDRIGGQEVLLPALVPKEPYQATGRWDEYGDLLFRLKDRKGGDYLLGPTHEELFTLLVKGEYSSYKDLPVTLYQVGHQVPRRGASPFGHPSRPRIHHERCVLLRHRRRGSREVV